MNPKLTYSLLQVFAVSKVPKPQPIKPSENFSSGMDFSKALNPDFKGALSISGLIDFNVDFFYIPLLYPIRYNNFNMILNC